MRWKDVPGYEGKYKVSDTGIIHSVDREVILKTKNGKPRPCNFKGRVIKQWKSKKILRTCSSCISFYT